MGINEVTREGVLAAIQRFDELGATAFLDQYGFGAARTYRLIHDGRAYDSKAIVGVAHQYDTGRPLTAAEFSGGLATVVPLLEARGFYVDRALPTDDSPDRADTAELTAQGLLVALENLRLHQQNGQVSLHKPLTLLWATGRLAADQPRLISWQEFRDQTRPLFAEFLPAGSDPTPQFPFWHLHTSGLWEVHGVTLRPGQRRPSLPELDAGSAQAGFTAPAAALLEDALLRAQAIAVLRSKHLASIDQTALLEQVGLGGYATAHGTESDLPEQGEAEQARRSVTISRRDRDTTLVARVKALHNHACQICGLRLQTRLGPYAEAAHIRGLGRPHDGPDELHNLLCLCPHDHIRFDTLTIYIDADDTVRESNDGTTVGRLRRHPGHPIASEHLRYHRALCGQTD